MRSCLKQQSPELNVSPGLLHCVLCLGSAFYSPEEASSVPPGPSLLAALPSGKGCGGQQLGLEPGDHRPIREPLATVLWLYFQVAGLWQCRAHWNLGLFWGAYALLVQGGSELLLWKCHDWLVAVLQYSLPGLFCLRYSGLLC